MHDRSAAPTSSSSAGKTVLLALLYCITGKLGLALALPPGYATVIWPPSGIAIGMLILHGWRLWPGVLIGSFLLNCYVSGAYTPTDGLVLPRVLAALGIACGSTLQALAGWLMVRRFFGLPLKLNRVQDVISLFGVCGPAACLVAATVGVGTLYFSGLVPAEKIVDNWSTWWMGDIFGVLVFLPLIFVAPFGIGGLNWRGHQVSGLPVLAMFALVLPLGLTFYAWKITAEHIREQNSTAFEALAAESENALKRRLESYDYALLGGVAYFQGSSTVSRREWRTYVRTINIKDHFPGIICIGYVDALNTAELPHYLEETRQSIPDFTIHPQTPPHAPHYIITYAEPEDVNYPAIGLNIAFEASRREAAERSRDSGEAAVTRKIGLVQDKDKMPGFLLLHPMYRQHMPTDTPDARRAALRGWIYAAFVAKDVLQDLTKSQARQFNLKIYEGTEELPENLIYNSNEDQPPATHTYTLRKQIQVMQQQWLVVWASTPAFEQSQRSDEPLFVMVGGLVFTGLFGLFLLVVTVKRAETMEWMATDKGYVLPALIFLVAAGGAFYLYETLRVREEHFIQNMVSEQQERVRLLIASDMQSKLLALKRMGQRWEAAGGTPRAQWQKDAAHYIEQIGGLRTMEWVDAAYRVRWVEPLAGNEKAAGLNVLFNDEREHALKDAATRNTITLTPPLDLVQGYKAIIAYSPVRKFGRFDGFMTAIFSIDDFFNHVVNPYIADNFDVTILHKGNIIFRSRLAEGAADTRFTGQTVLRTYDKEWVLRLVPSKKFVETNTTSLPTVLLCAGLLIALLVSLTVRAVFIAKIRTFYLAESNKLNTAIMSSTDSLIIATDKQGTVVTFNKAAENSLGYKAADVIGKKTPALWHDKDEIKARAEELGAALGQAVEPGFDVFITRPRTYGKESREWSFIRSDGTCFPGNLTVTPLRDADGRVTGYLGVIENIIQRKRAEFNLKTSEETFRSAMEHAPIGMALVNLGGQWMRVNKALCDLIGYTREELLLTDFQTITHPEDLERDLDYVRQLLAGEINHYEMEKRYFHKSGRVICVVLNVSLVRDAHGQPNYFIAQIQDITERKAMERMKGEFISIVSHELRTPLTSIRGSLGLVLGPFSKDLPEKVNGLLDIAYKNCERLILLINDILDIEKIESGKMRMDMKPESLAAVTQQAVDANEAYAQKFETHIELLPIDESMQVEIDSARYIQALSNLLSNAAKFSPPGKPVSVFVTNDGRRVRVCVQDHGAGIPPEFRTRIFGKFSQADSSATRSQGGTGLGLNITKQIVEHMGGTIGFDSEVNKGAVFWIEFPLINAPKQKGDPGHRHKILRRILVCENDGPYAKWMCMVLEKEGFSIDTAYNIPQARRMLAQGNYVAMTLNLHLPMGDGLEFLRQLRLEPHTCNLPVVVLSTSDSARQEREEDSKRLGITEWLTKPIKEDHLATAVRQAIAQSGPLPRILHVEDDQDFTGLIATALEGRAEIVNASTLRMARSYLRMEVFNLLVLDLAMPDGSGEDLLKELGALVSYPLPVIVLTASEPPKELYQDAAAVLVKSRTSESAVISAIQDLLLPYCDITKGKNHA